MGFTGGFLGSKAMFFASANAPKHLQDDTGNIYIYSKTWSYIAFIGNIMGTCAAIGLVLGAAISFVILAVM